MTKGRKHAIVLLILIVVGMFALGSVPAGATVGASTPPGQSVVTPVPPTPTPAPPSPTIAFDAPQTLPSADDFFAESGGRSDVADYDNPAFNVDQEVEGSTAGTNYLNSLMSENAETVDLVIMLTLLGLVPTMLIMLTGFMRIVIVLSFTRNALGTQNMPPNQVVVGLALFLTFFLMSPVLTEIYEEAFVPYAEEQITITEMGDRAIKPLRTFMFKQTYKDDLNMFLGMAEFEPVDDLVSLEDVPTHVLIPAFLTSELKHAFLLGFFIYIPFIVIDMIVASTLMSMGMMMLPPVMISLPFKVLLFVSTDGWSLVMKTLLAGFK